ncbi:peptide-methionine (S)-S-oxide reductase MsrA [Corynebacterium caspium]|uniref:peptide-methionine (S)-S-oxide reductase MsrA n=1 Tax=Corynebacterium caspium TaxID=234828 RepID=UPI0003719BC8|nr:peptide-methionine (S)-S-oxide reductase MsrA [Corynebacterium caspium]WKD60004.1 Peptide methionine sulfoxide reductase MsrA [Corynebacterium caspium DSM 44850]
MGFLFAPKPSLVDPADTLAGGSHPVLPNPQPHAVLGTPITGPWRPEQREVYVGLGCYWGAEKIFWETPGVEATAVGFAGGQTPNPTYREVCSGRTNHTEIVRVIYDPEQVSFADLIAKTMEAHDPTQGFRQGNDVGTQYRSAIYTSTPEEAAQAQEIVSHYAKQLADAGFGQITTEVKTLADTPAGTFYLAEDEHQQYLHKIPDGYCPHHSTGVACRLPE